MPDEIMIEKTLQERADEINALRPGIDTHLNVTVADIAIDDIKKADDTVMIYEYSKNADYGIGLTLTKQIIKSESVGHEVWREEIYDLENPLKNKDGQIAGYNILEHKKTLIK